MIEKRDCFEALNDVGLELTTNCNLNCIHCWQGAKNNQEILSLNNVRNIMGQLTTLGVSKIRITGGEPFIHPNFWEIMDETVNGKMRVVLRTNGILIDESAANRLRDYKIEFCEVSIDGSNSSIHDGFRRKSGALHKTLFAIEALLKNKIKVRVKTVIYKDNLEDIVNLGKLLIKDYPGIEMWSLVDLIFSGNAYDNFQTILPSPSRIIASMKRLGEWKKKKLINLNITGSAFQLVVDPGMARKMNMKLDSPCSYRKGYLYICSDGSVKSCPWLPGSLGNAIDNLKEMWQIHCQQEPVQLPEECVSCSFFEKGFCGYMYYVCPAISCSPERKEFLTEIFG